jgi:hypothetical protein
MSDETDTEDPGSSCRADSPLTTQSRRDLLKKGVYVTPTLLVLGTLATLNGASAQSTCGSVPFPCEPTSAPPAREPRG